MDHATDTDDNGGGGGNNNNNLEPTLINTSEIDEFPPEDTMKMIANRKRKGLLVLVVITCLCALSLVIIFLVK